MNLDRHAREYYVLAITTLPSAPATAWKASFDDEATWVAGTAVTGYDDNGTAVSGVGWLIAGPDFDATAAAATPNPDGTVVLPDVDAVHPKVRLIDNPEVPIRSVPSIYLEAG